LSVFSSPVNFSILSSLETKKNMTIDGPYQTDELEIFIDGDLVENFPNKPLDNGGDSFGLANIQREQLVEAIHSYRVYSDNQRYTILIGAGRFISNQWVAFGCMFDEEHNRVANIIFDEETNSTHIIDVIPSGMAVDENLLEKISVDSEEYKIYIDNNTRIELIAFESLLALCGYKFEPDVIDYSNEHLLLKLLENNGIK
jgi:hypothetical protein